MEKFDKSIGKRLKFLRSFIAEGVKLSADQFAYLIDENGDKIRNYEMGRAAVPLRVISNLLARGISAEFMIAGTLPIFANSEEGARLSNKLKNRGLDVDAMYSHFYDDELKPLAKVAAGDLSKFLK